MTPDQITAKVAAGYVKAASKVGTLVTFRRVTNTGGASPATNPVTGAITVSAPALAGASTVTLTAPVGNWFLETGDMLTIGGSDYTVTVRKLSASSKFTDVAVSPVLAGNVSAGAAVAVTWVGDYPCRAEIDSYSSNLIDGTLIKAVDLCVRLPTTSTETTPRTLPLPGPLDKIGIGGAWRQVGIVAPEFQGSGPVWFDAQAKG
jgi:hypothetical protein